MPEVELFSPGSLGTCWYGKYHYLEPWVGCEHNCPYCYSRSRISVRESLRKHGTKFDCPIPLLPPEQLLRAIDKEANSGLINIVKLSRYTDIFTPQFVQNGLSHAILEVLAKSKVKRIIITTKGLPSSEIIRLMTDNAAKFSYNAAFRPSGLLPESPLAAFDSHLNPIEERLQAAQQIQSGGCLTTIHCDPFVAGIDDAPEALYPFLELLKKYHLNRVMWSYLLFSPGIMEEVRRAVPAADLDKILSRYNTETGRQVLPNQEDTISWAQNNETALKSVDTVAQALIAGGFQFVLCSLKSIKGLDLSKYPRTMLCDGKFYA